MELTQEDRAALGVHPDAGGLLPCGDHVLVRVDEAKQTSEGGVILTPAAQVAPREGTIVGVGEGRYLECGTLIRPPFEVGERVLFSSYAGIALDEEALGTKGLKVISASDIQCRRVS
jgi:chaperonin GroES